MRDLLFGSFPGGCAGLALLLLRVVMGVAFVQHGFGKLATSKASQLSSALAIAWRH